MDEFEEEPLEIPEPKGDVRAAYCRKVAANVLRRAGVNVPPVPVENLVESIGLQILRTDLVFGVDAVLRPDLGTIELSSRQSGVRQRFSLAHELGHHYLGHVHNQNEVAEVQANIFAGALLVPSVWLRQDVASQQTTHQLAERYQVSREVIFIALKDSRLLNKVR